MHYYAIVSCSKDDNDFRVSVYKTWQEAMADMRRVIPANPDRQYRLFTADSNIRIDIVSDKIPAPVIVRGGI